MEAVEGRSSGHALLPTRACVEFKFKGSALGLAAPLPGEIILFL